MSIPNTSNFIEFNKQFSCSHEDILEGYRTFASALDLPDEEPDLDLFGSEKIDSPTQISCKEFSLNDKTVLRVPKQFIKDLTRDDYHIYCSEEQSEVISNARNIFQQTRMDWALMARNLTSIKSAMKTETLNKELLELHQLAHDERLSTLKDVEEKLKDAKTRFVRESIKGLYSLLSKDQKTSFTTIANNLTQTSLANPTTAAFQIMKQAIGLSDIALQNGKKGATIRVFTHSSNGKNILIGTIKKTMHIFDMNIHGEEKKGTIHLSAVLNFTENEVKYMATGELSIK